MKTDQSPQGNPESLPREMPVEALPDVGLLGGDPPIGPIERLNLATALGDIAARLGGLEKTLSEWQKEPSRSHSSVLLDFCKVLLGGWPAFGFLFLILFYSPLREALMSIPDKVRSADEIQLAGVSLKSTIKKEAIRLGAGSLSETLPSLSSAAIGKLLRSPRFGTYQGLVSYSYDNANRVERVSFPSESISLGLAELQKAGLITIDVEGGAASAEAINGLFMDFSRKYQGEFGPPNPGARAEELTWKLTPPVAKDSVKIPRVSWGLTGLGTQAYEVILKAVSAELAPRTQLTK